MCHLHNHASRKTSAARKYDPTRTGAIRKRYEGATVNRFKALRKLLIDVVARQNALGLPASKPLPVILATEPMGPVDLRPRFQFTTSDAKVKGFMAWLKRQVKAGVLSVEGADGEEVFIKGENWQDLYLRTAYQKGMNDTYSRLSASGYFGKDPTAFTLEGFSGQAGIGSFQSALPFNAPIHADALRLLSTRNYEALKGITESTSRRIADVLTRGLAEGRSPYDVARQMAAQVDKIGIARARVLARTEIINTYNESALNTLQQAGIDLVGVEVEWSAALDDRVCPECAGMDGQVYSIGNARGMIPAHPNCRCSFIPHVEKATSRGGGLPQSEAA